MQVSMIKAKIELGIQADHDGKNLGISVGEGLKKHRKVTTDPKDIERFMGYLKRAR